MERDESYRRAGTRTSKPLIECRDRRLKCFNGLSCGIRVTEAGNLELPCLLLHYSCFALHQWTSTFGEARQCSPSFCWYAATPQIGPLESRKASMWQFQPPKYCSNFSYGSKDIHHMIAWTRSFACCQMDGRAISSTRMKLHNARGANKAQRSARSINEPDTDAGCIVDEHSTQAARNI